MLFSPKISREVGLIPERLERHEPRVVQLPVLERLELDHLAKYFVLVLPVMYPLVLCHSSR